MSPGIKENDWEGVAIFRNHERGVALVTVMAVILVVSMLGTAVLSLSQTEKTISVNQVRSTRAFYLAEAGIHYTLAKLQEDRLWRANDLVVDMGASESFMLDVEDSGQPGQVNVTAKSTIGSVTRTVKATIELPEGGSTLFSYMLLGFGGQGSNEIEQNAEVTGDTFSAQNISFGQHPVVNGQVITNGVVAGSGASDIEDKVELAGWALPEAVEPDYPTGTFPTWQENWYLDPGLGDPVTIPRDVSRASVFQTGASYYHVQGDVDLGSNINLANVTIVADGDISLGQRTSLTNVTLKAGGDLKLGQKSSLDGGWKLVAEGELTIGQESSGGGLSGTLWAGTDLTIEEEFKASAPVTIYSGGDLDLGQEAEISGEIYSQGEMDIEKELVSDDLYLLAGGDLKLGQDANLGQAEIYGNGDVELGKKLVAAELLVSAADKLELGEQAQVSGSMYARTEMEIGQDLNASGGLTLVSGGDLEIEQQANMVGVIYSYSGWITVKQDFEFHGSMAAAGFTIGQNANMEFDSGAVEANPVAGLGSSAGPPSVISWQEL